MVFWFSAVIGTWLVLSVLVSLGLARAIGMSDRSVRLAPVSNRSANAAYPVIPIQSRRSVDRLLTSMDRSA